jgi:hypothetical protein
MWIHRGPESVHARMQHGDLVKLDQLGAFKVHAPVLLLPLEDRQPLQDVFTQPVASVAVAPFVMRLSARPHCVSCAPVGLSRPRGASTS